MRDKLRRRYQVHKEVSRNGFFEGSIPLADLIRLNDFLLPDELSKPRREIKVRFEFERNEYDLPAVRGRLETRVALECQRCLGALDYPLELDFQLMIDASDELVRSSSVDTLYSEDGYIDIFAVIEDELILAIPLVARHDDRACNEHWRNLDEGSTPPEENNPFAVLRNLETAD